MIFDKNIILCLLYKMFGEGSEFDQGGYKLLRCYNNSLNSTIIFTLRANVLVKPYHVDSLNKYNEILSNNKFYAKKAKIYKIETLDEIELPDNFFNEFKCYAFDDSLFQKFYPGKKIKNMTFYRNKKDVYTDFLSNNFKGNNFQDKLEDYKICIEKLKKYNRFWISDKNKYHQLQKYCENEYNEILRNNNT
ncbi:hypothetical protein [Moumouvirus maliensis]|nr:hypothetical protein [Moumouvirus maliensis]